MKVLKVIVILLITNKKVMKITRENLISIITFVYRQENNNSKIKNICSFNNSELLHIANDLLHKHNCETFNADEIAEFLFM